MFRGAGARRRAGPHPRPPPRPQYLPRPRRPFTQSPPRPSHPTTPDSISHFDRLVLLPATHSPWTQRPVPSAAPRYKGRQTSPRGKGPHQPDPPKARRLNRVPAREIPPRTSPWPPGTGPRLVPTGRGRDRKRPGRHSGSSTDDVRRPNLLGGKGHDPGKFQ